jgi:DNA-directed RNA polymerase subunit RPC12/RpoP
MSTEIGREMRCAHCGKTFISSWTDEEADAETLEYFGVEAAHARSGMVVICDDCWQRVKPDQKWPA